MSRLNPYRAIGTAFAVTFTIAALVGIGFVVVNLIIEAVAAFSWGALLIPVFIALIAFFLVSTSKLFERIGRAWKRAEYRWDAKRRLTAPSSELIPDFQPHGELA